MTLYILDPNLDRDTGHHVEWDLSIARAARARGEGTVIYANRAFAAGKRESFEIVPWFSHTTYERRALDPVAGRFDDFTYFNEMLTEELSRLPRELFTAADAVLVPTLTEHHLLGYVSWMKSFPAARAPLFVVHLMFPTGMLFEDSFESMTVGDPFQALFYRLAFRRAREPGADIHFFGGGRQLAREFSYLVEAQVDPHPVPICPIRSVPKPRRKQRRCLLFAGDAKADKGFLLLPGLAERLSQHHVDWEFVVHANASAAWGEAVQAHKELVAFAETQPNLHVMAGRLTNEEYQALQESCDAMVSTYDPVVYAQKSSGVLWESVSLELPVLVPQHTWLEREAREWGAGYMTYAEHSVDSIAARFADFAREIGVLEALSATAATRYHAFNGSEAVVDQIGRLWAPRIAAASLVEQPKELSLPLDTQSGEGWYCLEKIQGRPARWSGKTFDVTFDWPFVSGWQLEIKIRNFIGAEQVTAARASAQGTALACSNSLLDGGGGVITVSGSGQGRDQSETRVRVELPWTYRPDGKQRDLGVFVTELMVRPAATAGEMDTSREMLVTSAIVPNGTGDGFLLTDVVSGQVLLDPRKEAAFAFTLRTPGGPAVARAVRCYVNGIEVELCRKFEGKETWQVTGLCDSSLISARGLVSEWDLWLAPDLSSAPTVEVIGLTIGGNRLSVAGPPLAPDVAVISPAPTSYAERVVNMTLASPHAVSFDDGKDRAVIETVRLDQIDPEANYVDLSFFNLELHGEHWQHLKFKLCRNQDSHWLEFRERSDWPVMFVRWHGIDEDRFGRVFRLGSRMPEVPELLGNKRDAALLRALALTLPEGAAAALRQGDRSADLETWLPSALNVAEYLTVLLGATESRALAAAN